MFGISFSEMLIVAVIVLVAVGPRRLPGMLRQMGEWMGKARRMTTEVREQTGIDEVLRDEGLPGGLTELRKMMRGDFSSASNPVVVETPYEMVDVDASREYPVEGPDAYGALPDDLVPSAITASETTDEPPAGSEGSEAPPAAKTAGPNPVPENGVLGGQTPPSGPQGAAHGSLRRPPGNDPSSAPERAQSGNATGGAIRSADAPKAGPPGGAQPAGAAVAGTVPRRRVRPAPPPRPTGPPPPEAPPDSSKRDSKP